MIHRPSMTATNAETEGEIRTLRLTLASAGHGCGNAEVLRSGVVTPPGRWFAGSLPAIVETVTDVPTSESSGQHARPGAASLPGVVAVVVVTGGLVREATDSTVAETLDALAAQDYPNLQVLVLVSAPPESVEKVVDAVTAALASTDRLAGSPVRLVGDGVRFAAAASASLRFVEGDSGLFLFLDERSVLEPTAVGRLVDELQRSNAGLVGPKIVDLDDPRVLRSVGWTVDRIGEIDDGLEPNEIDQEQHDAVRDVFGLSEVGLMGRADLLRRLKGFDDAVDDDGAGLDLCWRAHLTGARVVVVPSAVMKLRAVDGAVSPLTAPAAASRTTTVLALTGLARLPLVALLALFSVLGAALVALIRGRIAKALADLGGFARALLELPSIVRRRRRARPLRDVADREVADLQVRGSVRWDRFRRERHFRALDEARRSSFGTARRSPLVTAVWAVALVLLVVGSRRLITDQVRPVGDLFPLSESPWDGIRGYLTGWWDRGLGATTPQPTGLGVLAAAGVVFFAQMGALHTFGLLGLVVLGWWGAFRLAGVVDDARARAAALVVYAATPLPYAALASGRGAVLVAYAVVPWGLHIARRLSGLGWSNSLEPNADEVVVHPDTRSRLRLMAVFVLVSALTASISPAALLVMLVTVALWASGVLLVGGRNRSAGLALAAIVVGLVGAVALNLPWAARYLSADGWSAAVGSSAAPIGSWNVFRFAIGPASLGSLSVLAYPSLVAVALVARSWRRAWASRMVLVAGGFLALALVADRGRSPIDLPEVGVLLVPVAVSLSIGAGLLVATFLADVRGARLGVRQPIALVSLLALIGSAVPLLSAATDGAFGQPSTSIAEQMDELLGATPESGDYRVLLIGDPELVPGAASDFDDVEFTLVRDARLVVDDRWSNPTATEDRVMLEALSAVRDRTTTRAGRLLAPLGVRYVVIPLVDRVRSTSEAPRPVASGLVEAFGEQLDLRSVYSPASMVVFENTQWIPVGAVLAATAAEASVAGGAASLAGADLSGSRPILAGASSWSSIDDVAVAGTVHLGVAFDERWSIAIDGQNQPAGRPSFGSVMAFDPTPDSWSAETGRITLRYDTSLVRYGWVLLQAGLWFLVVCVVAQPRWLRRRSRVSVAQPVLSMDGDRS